MECLGDKAHRRKLRIMGCEEQCFYTTVLQHNSASSDGVSCAVKENPIPLKPH